MRGLTAAERRELQSLDCSLDDKVEQDWTAEELALVAAGRAYIDTASDPIYQFTAATDLGRLALRVCPVGEP